MLTRLAGAVKGIPPVFLGASVALGALCVWAFWPTLATLADVWARDPQYSHGYLVPAFAVALLALRSSQREACTWRFSWLGVALLLVALGLQFLSDRIYFDWLDAAALIVSVAGLFALLGGWPALRWAWPGIAFLFFMVPLPFTVEKALAYPLRTIATKTSNYALQTVGLASRAQGHVILLDDVQLLVAEACSGLSMLVIFVALSTAVALLIKRPLLDRLIIVASSLPVAVLANVTRISVTGLMHQWVGHEIADLVFHDLAGWLMMPFALALLSLELWYLNRLLVPVERQQPLPLNL